MRILTIYEKGLSIPGASYVEYMLRQEGKKVLSPYKIKPASTGGWSGNVLFSHRATPAVSSELKGLTTVFGMGTGVSLPL
jgi:hypothetical protein